jgi:hypothetical protein
MATTRKRLAVLERQYTALEERLSASEARVLKLENAEPESAVLITTYGEKLGGVLIDAGYETVAQVTALTDEQLLAINGVGPASVKVIRGK